ncbi:pilus protein PilZ [Novosphingobium barchaimii LL02]|uniref:Pilus protein PilZ n=1 Tax=Novosphingobium barchaimii LL02 TaxID=1114963 RepID=A0A0J7Y787_9SPHN|nr:PilZ domain-containing protein [Novosphingobium barchaimii]KMS59819.1 pilus protein PilZ [Novosphingobium barchaimii LL02]
MVHTQQERYEAAAQEDRSAPRLRISIPASLRPSGSKGFQTAVRDLSLSGFSATAMTRVAPRTICWLTLPGMDTVTARVVWWDNGLIGCAFDHLLNPMELEAILSRWNGDNRKNRSF